MQNAHGARVRHEAQREARDSAEALPFQRPPAEREFFIDNLLVRIHFMI